MTIKFISIGKTVKSYLKEGELAYEKRLSRYLKFEEFVIPELKKAAKLSKDEIKGKEGSLILDKIDASDFLVLLDEKGKQMTSEELARWIETKQIYGTSKIVFVVGGAYGFSTDVYDRAQYKLSLSKMTFSHQMVRMIFKEQLYRAFTIIKGEPYHHS